MYIDVHTHLCDKKYGGEIDGLVESYRNSGVGLVINSGYNIPSSEEVMSACCRYEDMYFSAGVHPDDAKTLDNRAIDRLLELSSHEKCLAVGEIGFDFYWNKSTEAEQVFAFEKQMEIADHLSLPFVVHSRNAAEKTLKFLKERKSLLRQGFLMHCFSESAEMAKEFQKLGAYFSFGGVITFKNAKKEDVIRAIDTDRLLTETDAPYLTPHPYRGQINDSSKVVLVTRKMSEILQISDGEMQVIIENNARRLFKL